ncbi:hypothetical protein QR680_010106 [Steinernema hermaphroditum]|uniref:Uncharacterized protein n=1 Tax=Steinernema hermaphroditum TaxID=289476 RepID=A0AA39IMS4_9BILA|nr:hypothetical protein QR680_010106 [Steinernema hermaphroditum]
MLMNHFLFNYIVYVGYGLVAFSIVIVSYVYFVRNRRAKHEEIVDREENQPTDGDMIVNPFKVSLAAIDIVKGVP